MKPIRFFLFSLLLSHAILPSTDSVIELKQNLALAIGSDRLPILKSLVRKDLPITPEEYTAYGQELVFLARKKKDPASETLGMRTMAHAAYMSQEYETSLRILFESRDISNTADYTQGMIEANSEIGNLMFFCFVDLNKALHYYQQAFSLSKSIGYPMGMIKYLNNRAEVHMVLGEFHQALPLYLEAQTLFDREKSLPIRVKAVLIKNIALLNIRLGNMEMAIHYLEKALPDFERAKDQQNVFTTKGALSFLKEDYPRSLLHFQEALSNIEANSCMLTELSYNRLKASTLKNIGQTHLVMGNKSAARCALLEGQALAEKAQAQAEKANILLVLAKLALAEEDDIALLEYARENEQFCRKHRLSMELKDVLDLMAEAYTRRGDYQKALLYRQKGDELKQELREPRLAASVISIIEKYEKAQMSRHIGALQQRRIQFMILAVLLLLILGILLLWYLPWIKRRARMLLLSREQRLQEQEKRMESLSKRLQQMEHEQVEWRVLKGKISLAGQTRYQKSSLSTEDAGRYLQMLSEIIDKEKVYLDPDLSLATLSERLGINRSYLSQIINEHLGKSFVEYISGFRIEYAKQVLLSHGMKKINILKLINDAGFNSKTSFYRLFKSDTGLSPFQFIQHNVNASVSPPKANRSRISPDKPD